MAIEDTTGRSQRSQDPYIPLTPEDRRQMLHRIGVAGIEQLLQPIPTRLRLDRPLAIESEAELPLRRRLRALAGRNRANLVCFAGGGVYDHFIPAAVAAAVNRPEFVTAYTPYQPEVAQGTLQVIYEFQTHICRLTAMDVANASLYDGASALAEAVILAVRATQRSKVVVAESVNPLYREVLTTYLSGREVECVTLPLTEGRCHPDQLGKMIGPDVAAVAVAQPNFLGLLEEIEMIGEKAHGAGAKFICAVDPIVQAILKPAGECGADIVVGEGQPLGLPLAFGGPLLGFFAARKDLVRMIPGRLVGRTTDVEGREGFVLTLQTREQHIRRDKATSNICTNQALCATTAAAYLSLLGKEGLRRVALLSAEAAQAAAASLGRVEGVELYFGKAPFVREFAVKLPIPARQVVLALVERGVLPGIDAGRWYAGMGDCLIVAATEKRTAEEIEALAAGVQETVKSHAMSQV